MLVILTDMAVMCNAVSGYYDLVKYLYEGYQGIRYKSIPLFFPDLSVSFKSPLSIRMETNFDTVLHNNLSEAAF